MKWESRQIFVNLTYTNVVDIEVRCTINSKFSSGLMTIDRIEQMYSTLSC